MFSFALFPALQVLCVVVQTIQLQTGPWGVSFVGHKKLSFRTPA
jgi:hypothetical protein